MSVRRLLLALLLVSTAASGADARRVAFSFDDGFDPRAQPDARQLNEALLERLRESGVRTIYFVAGSRVDSPEGLALMRDWGEAGHAIANHTYSHRNFGSEKTTLAEFIADAERNQRLLASLPGWSPRFRFPFLKEGDTEAKRDGFRGWLDARGYGSGAVSIDASDWYYDQRMRQWMARHPGQAPDAFRAPYIAHLLDRAGFYESLGRRALGRDVAHVVLLHANAINARYFADVVAAFRSDGWTIVSPEEAYADPVYRQRPAVLPAGESLLWSLAKSAGIEGLRYPAEDGRYEQQRLDELGL